MKKRQLLVFILSFTLTFPPSIWSNTGTGSREVDASYEETKNRLSEYMDFLSNINGTLNRTQFELDALIEKQDFDPENIIEYVAKEINYEPYEGTLRGAKGTLISGAGNSLDQSILLATLLKDAGYDARIAKGTLSSEQKNKLLSSISFSKSNDDSSFDLPLLEKEFANYQRSIGSEVTSISNYIEEEVITPQVDGAEQDILAQNIESIMGTLERGKLEFNTTESAAGIIPNSYYWVEYKTSQNKPWKQVHPALISFNDNLNASEYIIESIPQQLQHRLRVEVNLDQRVGNQIHTHSILPKWERPSSNLVDHTLSISFIPDTFAYRRPGSVEDTLNESTFFIPLWNGKAVAGSKTFDLKGRVLSPGDASSFAAKLFRTISDKTDKAISAIKEIGSDSNDATNVDNLELLKVRINFTFIEPGGREHSTEKIIWDTKLFGNNKLDNNEELVKKKDLTKIHYLLPAVGRLSDSYLFSKTLDEVTNSHNLLKAGIDYDYDLVESKEVYKVAEKWYPEMWGLMRIFNSFDLIDHSEEETLGYRNSTNLVMISQSLFDSSAVSFNGVDIIKNTKTFLSKTSDKVLVDKKTGIQHGIWETIIEAGFSFDQIENDSAFYELNLASSEKSAWQTITRESNVTGISEAWNRQIEVLQQNEVLLIPNIKGKTSKHAWLVDLNSGTTKGINQDGRGASAAEYLKALLAVSAGAFMALKTTKTCIESGKTPFNCTLCGLFAGAFASVAVFVILPNGGSFLPGSSKYFKWWVKEKRVRALLKSKKVRAYLVAAYIAAESTWDGMCGGGFVFPTKPTP